MRKELFEKVNFSLAEEVLTLGAREKNAVKTLLRGLCEAQETDREQKPIRIEVAPNRPFSLRDFVRVMRDLGIDTSSLRKNKRVPDTTAFILQPKPCENNDFIKALIASKEASDHFIESFLDYEPCQTNSKPH